MDDWILYTIKKMLDLEDSNSFDMDLIVHINSALDIIRDNGVGKKGLYLTDGTQTWSDFIPDQDQLAQVKTFVYCKVKVAIDSTISNTYKETLLHMADEALWRVREYKTPATIEGD